MTDIDDAIAILDALEKALSLNIALMKTIIGKPVDNLMELMDSTQPAIEHAIEIMHRQVEE